MNRALTKAGVNSYGQLGKDAKNALEENLNYTMGKDGAQKFLGNLNKSAEELTKGMTNRGKAAGLDMPAEYKKLGYSDPKALQSALQKGGDEGDAAQKSLIQLQQLIATKERTNADPATAAREIIREKNIEIAKTTLDILDVLKSTLGPMGLLITSAISAGVGAILGGLSSLGLAYVQGKVAGGVMSRALGGATRAAPVAIGTATTGTAAATTAATTGTAAATNAAATGTAAAKKPGLLSKAGAIGKRFIPKTKAGMIAAGITGTAALAYGTYKWFGGGSKKSETGGGGGGVLEGVQQVFVVNWPECICGGNGVTGNAVTGSGINTTMVPNTEQNVGEMEITIPETEIPETGASSLVMPAIEGGLMLSAFKSMFSKAASIIPSATTAIAPTTMLGKGLGLATSTASGFLKNIGIAGAAYEIGMGGYKGYQQAEEAGLSKTTATLLGAITGKATTGTESGSIVGAISDNLGFERGGLADERIGQYGAMAGGAFNGAMIGGRFGGPTGAAVGAGVGTIVAGSAELSKVWIEGNQVAENLKAAAAAMSSSYEMKSKQLLEEKSLIKEGEDATSKIVELHKLLDSKKISLDGQIKNFDASKKSFDSKWLPSWVNPATSAAKADMQYDEKILSTTQKTIQELEKQISSLKNSLQTPSSSLPTATAENAPPLPAFAVGTQQITQGGLALVHQGEMIMPKVAWDTILAIGSGPFGNISDKLNVATPMTPKSIIEPNSKGAFENDQGAEAINQGLTTTLKMSAFKEPDTGNFIRDTFKVIDKNVLSTGNKSSNESDKTYSRSPISSSNLIATLSNIVSLLKANKSLIGPNNTGAFEADQTNDAVTQSLSTTIKMIDIVDKNNIVKDIIYGEYKNSMGALEQIINPISGISNILSNVYSTVTNPTKALIEPSNTGMFESDQGKDAGSQSITSMLKMMTSVSEIVKLPETLIPAVIKESINKSGISNILSNAYSIVTNPVKSLIGPSNTGMFESDQGKEAGSQSMTSMLKMSSIGMMMEPIMSMAKTGIQTVGATISNITGSNTCECLQTALKEVVTMFVDGSVSGGIGKGLFANDQVSDATNAAKTLNVEQSLSKSINNDVQKSVTQKETGAFETKEVMGEISSLSNSIMTNNYVGSLQSAINEKTTKSMINQKSLGMFDPESNIFDAMNSVSISDLNNIVSSAFDTKKSTEKKSIFAQISNALNYERTASEASESQGAKAITNIVDYGTGTSVSSNLMDYRDEMKGQVNPTIGPDGIRTSIEQKMTGESSLSSFLAPDISRIVDYMEDKQYSKLTEIANSLRQIEQMGKPSNESTIIGANGSNAPISRKSAVKSIAQDKARGFWDLGFSGSVFPTIPSEGRGGTS